MNKRMVFLMVTFLMASFLTSCTTGTVANNESASRATATERAR